MASGGKPTRQPMTTPTPRRSVSAAGRTGTSFRFIVAAEDGVALGDLKPLARRLMEQMGKDVVASAAARSAASSAAWVSQSQLGPGLQRTRGYAANFVQCRCMFRGAPGRPQPAETPLPQQARELGMEHPPPA
jgi:hypothetical protein